MKVKVTRTTSYTVEYDGIEYELQHEPADGSIKVKVLSDGTAVVGYLCQDEDCGNPLEDCDGEGKIIDRRSINAFNEACGIDEYGEKTGKPNPLAVLLDLYEHGGSSWSLSGEGMQCQWDTSKCAGVWVPDHCCEEHIKSVAIEHCLPEGTKVEYKSKYNEDGTCITRPCKPGEASYFKDENTVPDERYNNVITYTLPDGRTEGGFKTFGSAYKAAAKALGIKLNKATLKIGERKAAEVCAKQAVTEYNKWLAGDCWGIVVEVHQNGERVNDYEACWGFVGSEHAEEEMTSRMDNAAEDYIPKPAAEDVKTAEEEFAQ